MRQCTGASVKNNNSRIVSTTVIGLFVTVVGGLIVLSIWSAISKPEEPFNQRAFDLFVVENSLNLPQNYTDGLLKLGDSFSKGENYLEITSKGPIRQYVPNNITIYQIFNQSQSSSYKIEFEHFKSQYVFGQDDFDFTYQSSEGKGAGSFEIPPRHGVYLLISSISPHSYIDRRPVGSAIVTFKVDGETLSVDSYY